MRRTIIVTGAVGALALGFAAPASASTTGDTTPTFTLGAGSVLSVTVPAAAVDLGVGPTGGTTVTGPLGNITVTGARGLLVASWTATVSSTALRTGGAAAPKTVPNTAASYPPGLRVGSSGVGNNYSTWDRTITVTPPVSTAAGVTATITHSVS
jgi:hypothetical protein